MTERRLLQFQPVSINVEGFVSHLWTLTNMANGVSFGGMMLENGNFFIPVNGGKSKQHDFDEVAERNVETILENDGDGLRVVKSAFTLLDVKNSGSSGNITTVSSPIMSVTGILFEAEGKFFEEMPNSYPHIKIEPVFSLSH